MHRMEKYPTLCSWSTLPVAWIEVVGALQRRMVDCFALRWNIKVIPLSDVLSSGFGMASNGWGIIIFSEGLKVFGFSIMKPSFSFTNLKTITSRAICSVNNSGLLWTINAVLVRKGFRHGVAMLMSVFVQNIVDMIVDYALWVAVLKKEFSKIIEGRL